MQQCAADCSFCTSNLWGSEYQYHCASDLTLGNVKNHFNLLDLSFGKLLKLRFSENTVHKIGKKNTLLVLLHTSKCQNQVVFFYFLWPSQKTSTKGRF